MPWCPQCKCEYREDFRRCADCGVWLVKSLPPETPEREPEAVYSPTLNTAHLVDVYEDESRERLWLQDVLEDNSIPYAIKAHSHWTGYRAPQYHEVQQVFVEKRDEAAVRAYIDEYSSTDSIVSKDDGGTDGNALPQITCPSCDKEFDFDYPQCPFCNHPV